MPQGSVRLAFGIGFAASLVLGGVSVPAINVMEPQPGWALVVGASLAADIAKVGGMTVAREEAVHRSVSVAALPVFQETPSVARFVRPAILAQRDAPSKTWQPTLPQQEWLRAVMSGSEGDAKRETTKPGTTMVALGVPENASVSVVAKVVEMTSAAGSIAPPAPQVLAAPEPPVSEPTKLSVPVPAVVAAAADPVAAPVRAPQRKRRVEAKSTPPTKAPAAGEEKSSSNAQIATAERKRSSQPETPSVNDVWLQQPFPVRAAGMF